MRKVLKDGVVPSNFAWTEQETEANVKRKLRSERRQQYCNNTATVQSVDTDMTDEPIIIHDSAIEVARVEEVGVHSETANTTTQYVQTNAGPVLLESSSQTDSDPLPIMPIVRMTAQNYKDNHRGMQFYTGIDTYDIFMDIFTSLGPATSRLNHLYGLPNLVPEDQLFLTLMKLRTYKTNYELSMHFKVSELEVYNVFVTWIRFMSLQWRELNIWPEREVVHFYAPSDFKRKFPKTRVIFDGTECPIKKPKAPGAQQTTFSTYKNRNTTKVLVGVTPGGLVSYVSKAYGGSTTDRQIVERSDIMTKVDPTDTIMADKGFDVQDIFAPMDVGINIPTFFKKKNRMTGEIVLKDRAVSSKRVHVERIIGLGKTYKILCNPLNQTEATLSSDIIFVCYMLVNFRNCIVPRDA